MRRLIPIVLVITLLAAPTLLLPTLANPAEQANTSDPAAQQQPTRTPAPLIFATNTVAVTPSPVLTSFPTQPPINSPTPVASLDPSGTPFPTWTPPPIDPSVQIPDHYALYRPFSETNVTYLDRTYPYGGTSGGALQVHHGGDFANGQGTPILAAGAGTVYYAGTDQSQQFGPTTDYYGNLVVIQHNFTTPDGKPVFTLYGHMSEVSVQTGQTVDAGDVMGIVGGTGVAFGPHLHMEVRVGEPNSFEATRNPDLWLYPYQNYGTLAGRVTDSAGNLLYDATVQVRATTSRNYRYSFTYADNSVNGDDAFRENFTLGDLPANYYEVSVNDGQRVRFQTIIYAYPGRTTWLDIVLN